MQELGAISLELFHAAPLKRGSQTATLMVMAGISNAAGLDIVPRVMQTDHFIEAETTPYQYYIRDYGSKFIIPPQRSKPPVQPIDVDDRFMALTRQQLRSQYIQIANPADRLTHYIRDSEDPFFQVPVTVKELEIKDNTIAKLHIQPRSQQASIEQALEFVGHEEIIDSLGLEPGKYVASHTARARSQKTAPRQR
jgi:hypothetical protein